MCYTRLQLASFLLNREGISSGGNRQLVLFFREEFNVHVEYGENDALIKDFVNKGDLFKLKKRWAAASRQRERERERERDS